MKDGSELKDERLLTPADLGELFGVTEQKILEWRRRYGWPSIKVGRSIRFTSEHVEKILVVHTVDESEVQRLVRATGLTRLSAARHR